MKEVVRKLISFAVIGLAIAGFAILTTACSGGVGNSNNNNNSNTTDPFATVPTSTTSPTQTYLQGQGGAQAPLAIVSQSVLDQYVGWSTNAPTNEEIGVNLVKLGTISNGSGGYDYELGGAVSIAFNDNGYTYSDTFNSHLQGQPNTVNSDAENNQYNLVSVLYPASGQYPGKLPAFHGFFQATTYCIMNGGATSYPLSPGEPCYGETFGGAVILVMDHMGFNADGEGATSASGEVYFYNFQAGTGAAPLPGTSCWFITLGPYQCGSFFNGGDSIQTKSSLYPTSTHLGNGSYINYTELGTFQNLNLGKALNGQLQ